MSITARIEFVENFRELILGTKISTKTKIKLKLISIKMPEDLLAALKRRAHQEGLPYQTLIKNYLRQTLER